MKTSAKKKWAHWLGFAGLAGTFTVTLVAAPAAVFAPIAMAGSIGFLTSWWGAEIKHIADTEESKRAAATEKAIFRELGRIRQAVDALVVMVSAILAASLLRLVFALLQATLEIVVSGWFWMGAIPVAMLLAAIVVFGSSTKLMEEASQPVAGQVSPGPSPSTGRDQASA